MLYIVRHIMETKVSEILTAFRKFQYISIFPHFYIPSPIIHILYVYIYDFFVGAGVSALNVQVHAYQ